MQPPIKSQKTAVRCRPLSDILEDLRRANEATVQAQLAHMNMTPEQHRAAEEKVAAQQGGERVFRVQDLVRAHEESTNLLLPKGFLAIDLEA